MIIPGILENDWKRVQTLWNELSPKVERIQIDIVDESWGNEKKPLTVDQILQLDPKSNLEIHLMVQNPNTWIEEIIRKKGYREIFLTIQVENLNTADIGTLLKTQNKFGYQLGLSLAPNTLLEEILPYISESTYIQLMGVHPGRQGQKLIPETLNKIRQLKNILDTNQKIQVDGGINEKTLRDVLQAGANDVVIGSAITLASNPKEAYMKMTELTERISQ